MTIYKISFWFVWGQIFCRDCIIGDWRLACVNFQQEKVPINPKERVLINQTKNPREEQLLNKLVLSSKEIAQS